MSPLYNPGASLGGGGALIQTAMVDITVDTTTTSTSFVDLMSTSITTGANFLMLNFSASCTNTTANAGVSFRLLVDGTPVHGAAVRYINTPGHSCAIVHRIPVTAATHTVKVQWFVTAGTGRVRPIAVPNSEHATLVLMEVSN